jgi:hypothetical protein
MMMMILMDVDGREGDAESDVHDNNTYDGDGVNEVIMIIEVMFGKMDDDHDDGDMHHDESNRTTF